MSKRLSMVELSAPDIVNTPSERIREVIVSVGHVCKYCNGMGEVNRLNPESHEWEFSKCPVCKGSGEMDATVTIDWKAAERN